MKQGFTQAEAEELVSRIFETRAPLPRVPRRTRGQVIEIIDADDHWNVLIEWLLAGTPLQQWFTKFEVNHYMFPIQSNEGIAT